jgi:hypothetical protein
MQQTDILEDDLDNDVLKTLLYFDIFKYPLKPEETLRFLQRAGVTLQQVDASLNNLAAGGIVHKFDPYYSLCASDENVVRRVNGNREAERITPFARKRGALIASFPFVKAVMASGSFSKDYMDEKSDLDFFVITSAGKLWIAKTLLAIYKRVFLRNSHKYFCTNYFVDEEHMEISEKNLFTATELATLVPLVNYPAYERLIRSNGWVREFLPNFIPRKMEHKVVRRNILRSLVEAFFIPFAALIEKMLMRLSASRLKRLYSRQFTLDDFNIAFKSTSGTSKSHPRNFQAKVMDLYHRKLADHDLQPL